MARALLDSSTQLMFCNQEQNGIFQSCKCGCNVNHSSGLLDGVILQQIGFFILEAVKSTLNHDVVNPAAFSAHALADIIFFYKVNVPLAHKLANLIQV